MLGALGTKRTVDAGAMVRVCFWEERVGVG